MTINLNGKEYPLSTKLRVAYLVQGQHNHKPYAEIFKGMGEMCVEHQIGIVFASFKCANKEDTMFDKNVFTEYMLDNYDLKQLMDMLQGIIEGIMGGPTPVVETDSTSEDDLGN